MTASGLLDLVLPWSAASVVVVTAYAYLAVISVILARIDVREHRLPDRIVLPAYPIAVVAFTIACLLGAPWSQLLGAVLGGAAMFAFYLALRLARLDGMGGGDVKLAGVLGLFLGWIGWGPVVAGASAAFLLGGLYALVLTLLRRADRRTTVPFGPWMLVGAWIGILLF